VTPLAEQLSVAMQFTGFLHISQPGVYRFHLLSDDGARLFVGDATLQCHITKLERKSPPPTPHSLGQALGGGTKAEWVSLEGNVGFASRRSRQIELEIMDRNRPVSVLIASTARLEITNVIKQRVHTTPRRAGCGANSNSLQRRHIEPQ
jgi:hypothetical protein